MRQFNFESVRKSTLLAEKKVKIEKSEETHNSAASHQSRMVMENGDFLLVLKFLKRHNLISDEISDEDFLSILKHVKKHNLIFDEISAALKASLDPAKLALQAIQGIYHCLQVRKTRSLGRIYLGEAALFCPSYY